MHLDRCHTCNFIARFCRATLSRDKIANVTWRVAQLVNSQNSAFTHLSVSWRPICSGTNLLAADVSYAIVRRCCDFLSDFGAVYKYPDWTELNSRANPLPIRAALYFVQLCREKAVNADWSILVYATKLQCATLHVTLAILSRDKVARQNRAIKLQVWHQS